MGVLLLRDVTHGSRAAVVTSVDQTNGTLLNASSLMKAPLEYDSCNSHHSCEECLNASRTCHFCANDYSCHVIGSPEGCLIGVSQCYKLEDCKRKKPQKIGYGPTPAVIVTMIVFFVISLSCGCGIGALYSMLTVARANDSHHGLHELEDMSKPLIHNDGEESGGSEFKKISPKGKVANKKSGKAPDISSVDDRAAFQRDDEPVSQLGGSRRIHLTISKRLIAFFLLLIMTVLGLMYYPRVPDYNICNREFDWASILHSVDSLHPKIEYNLLISVSNENRFGFLLTEGEATIHHNGTAVGSWRLEKSFTVAPGSISDIITTIRIEPKDVHESLSLWEDFRADNLWFDINASATGYITYGLHRIFKMSGGVGDIRFRVGAKQPRDLCKCTEWLTPTN